MYMYNKKFLLQQIGKRSKPVSQFIIRKERKNHPLEVVDDVLYLNEIMSTTILAQVGSNNNFVATILN